MIREAGSAGLYIHIPFCKSKCVYCDFCSSPASEAVKKEYVSALSADLKSKTRDTRQITTVYVGGGTPSCLADGEITRILETVKGKIADGAEITVEVNPESFTPSKAEEYKNAGVNRISIGVQSLDDGILARLGRLHDSAQAVDAVKLASRYFDRVSCDLIIGLDGQTGQGLKNEISVLTSAEAGHISCYALKVEEGTKLAAMVAEGYKLPDDDRISDLYDVIYDTLKGYGYQRYEVSNFALPGQYSRHNYSYWTGVPYIGVGVSAHGFTGRERYGNLCDVGQYIEAVKAGKSTVSETVKLSDEDLEAERIMLALRTERGLNVPEFNRRFKTDFYGKYSRAIMTSGEAVCSDGDYFRIRPEYFYVMNSIIIEFLP